jgi:protein-tyrosine phosphatase
MKVLMVCLGNICRSPMAEGILEDLVQKANLDWQIDSAGTGAWHIGEQPDQRAIAVCAGRGIDIRRQRARQIAYADLDQFDLILTMDAENHSHVLSMSRTEVQRRKIQPIMSYGERRSGSVPDPYFDGSFEEVFDLLHDLCRRIVEKRG